MNYKYLLVLALGLGTQCFAQTDVIYHPEAPASDNIVRIYVDRDGNVYPQDKKYDVKDHIFYSPNNGAAADLRAYYTENDRDTYKRLLRHYHLKNFNKIQDTLIAETANAINQRLQPNGKLVVLIHGFNNTNPGSDYSDMEDAVNARLQNANVVYLEVYWDGMKTKRTTDVAFEQTWEAARGNAANAGLTVRKLIAQVDNGELYILTHSLGASVGTGILFNIEGKKGGSMGDDIYTPKQNRVTLAMIAPCIEGKDVFENVRNTVPRGEAYNYKRFVVGFNSNDYTIMNGIEEHPSKHYGSLVGCDIEAERAAEDAVKAHMPTIGFFVTDFTYDSNVKDVDGNTNTLAPYMQSPKFKEFMDYTFAK